MKKEKSLPCTAAITEVIDRWIDSGTAIINSKPPFIAVVVAVVAVTSKKKKKERQGRMETNQ